MPLVRRGLCALALLTFQAFAQTDRGNITGTVATPAGDVVSNAQIELNNTQNGTRYPGTTSLTGNYTFSQLPVGLYRLTITATGFKIHVLEDLTLAALQTLRRDIVLIAGGAAETVVVADQGAQLITEGGEMSFHIAGDRLVSLPVLPIGNGFASAHGIRNPLSVVNFAPGSLFEPNVNLRVNGVPSNTISIRIDGQDATNGLATFAQSHTQPSVEALEELTLQTSNYAAEFGQAGGGLMSYTTKSGGNHWHGSLYNYNANEFYNAAQSFKKERPKLRRNDYGGTLGGPVWIPKAYDGRNRTFFFWGYEVFAERAIVSSISPTVPTDAYRAGDFRAALSGRPITGNPADVTGQRALDGQIYDPNTQFTASDGRRVRTPFPNNTIPAARFDPSAVKLLALIPRPTSSALVTNFNNPYKSDRNTNIPSLKLDHSLSAWQKLSFYWSTTETAVQDCTPGCSSEGFPAPVTQSVGTFIESYTLRLNYDHTLTPSLLLHLGAGYLNNDLKGRPSVTNYDTAGALGIRGATVGPENSGTFPVFQNMVGLNSSGGLSNLGPNGISRSVEQKPTFNASLSWVKGNHTFKFGGEFRTDGIINYNLQYTSGRMSFSPAETGNPWFADANVAINGGAVGFPLASLLLGRVNLVSLSALAAVRGGRKYTAFFVQDTWKITRRLTLDYGLRHDYGTYAQEQYGRTPAFSPNVPNATSDGRLGGSIFEATCNCKFAHNYPHAWGPRIGVAYRLNDKTVLRAGIGVVYATVLNGLGQGTFGATATGNPPAGGDPAMIMSQGFPVKPVWPDLRPNLFPDPGSFGGQPFVTDQNAGRPARQVQWSVGLQREILRDLMVEAGYVGTRGVWWRSGSLAPYNVLSNELLAANGLDIRSAADRTILAAQIGQPAAGRFRNRLPFASYPTGFTVARSLTPFPQFGAALFGPGPLGKTWYDGLQVRLVKRFSHGLDFNYNYVYSKELQLGAENDGGGGLINDILNRDTNKQFSQFSRPHRQVFTASYTLPQWGSNKWLNLVASDWVTSGAFGYSSGQPIPIPATALPTSNLGAALLRATRAERIAGVPLFLQDLNCHCFDPSQTQVLNPAAWKDPEPGTFTPSAAYYNDYRYQRRPFEAMSFGRVFRFGERARFLVRAEFTNVFNRAQNPNPVSSGYTTAITRNTVPIAGGSTSVSVNNTGFGVIATQPTTAVTGERSGLLVARLTF